MVALTLAGSVWSTAFVVADGAMQEAVTLNASMFTMDGPTAIALASHALESTGVALNISLTSSSTEQMRGLSNGTYDLAYTAFDNVLAWSGREGAEIIAVATLGKFGGTLVAARLMGRL